jgi:hypothetical protein
VLPNGSFEIEVALPTGGSHPVSLAPTTFEGAAWLDLRGLLGAARQLSLGEALKANAESPVGAVGVHRGVIVVRQLLRLDGLEAQDLDDALGVIAYQCQVGRALAR